MFFLGSEYRLVMGRMANSRCAAELESQQPKLAAAFDDTNDVEVDVSSFDASDWSGAGRAAANASAGRGTDEGVLRMVRRASVLSQRKSVLVHKQVMKS